jgi:hypothetical protein
MSLALSFGLQTIKWFASIGSGRAPASPGSELSGFTIMPRMCRGLVSVRTRWEMFRALAQSRYQRLRSRRLGSLRTRQIVAAEGRIMIRSRSPQFAKPDPVWGVPRKATLSTRAISLAASSRCRASLSAVRNSCLMTRPPRLCPIRINGPSRRPRSASKRARMFVARSVRCIAEPRQREIGAS